MQKMSFDELYRSYMLDVFNYLRHLSGDYHLAEDLMSETFYRAYLFLEYSRGDSVKPWLLKVAHNAYVDHLRKHNRVRTEDRAFFERAPGGETPEKSMLRKEHWREIGRVIAGLPEKQKQAILLHDYQGLQYREAAEVMQVSVNHFKVLLFRARQKVRSAKGSDHGYE